MNKLYTRIEWENFPSEKSPLNEANLNRMDLALDNMDNRVIEMDSTKVNVEVANTLIKNWTMDEATGVITVEKLNGEKIIFDLNTEKIPVAFKLSEDGILTMTTDDGTQFTANIGAMIPILTFEDSDTIVVSVEGTGVNKTYSFSIKAGSVTEDKLQPNFLADVKTEVAKAQASQESAAQSASDASSAASAAAISESNAKTSETEASESASAAKESETNAGESATNAASSAQSASDSAGNSLTYANSANESAVTASEKAAEALESATSASDSATSASISASSAGDSATVASDSAILAESYTHGGTGAREGEDTDNAKYYMEQAKAVSKVDIATKDLAGISKPGDGLEIVPDGTMNVSGKIVQHPGKTINSEDGVHGLREWDGKLEYFDGKDWIEIKTGGSSIGVGDVVGASIVASSRQATLKWTDPDDIEVSGATIAAWAGTKLIRKEGSAPESIADGVVVVDNTEKNKYSSEGYTDTGLENGTTYYYRFFPYTTDGVVTAGTSLNATPERIVITTVPSQSGTLTYNGSAKTPSWSNYDSSKMTIGGTTSATNAGAYTATFTPKEDYMWSDGSIAAKSVAWKINKTSGSVALSSTSVELNLTYTSKTVTVSGATGTVTVSSNNTSVATASISGNTITINSVSNTSGSAIITVSVASSTNYNATSKTISVTASFVLDGETATPINDVQTWLKCDSTGRAMQQGSNIKTLSEVIANSDILGYLMSDESAMQYLARSTGFADEGCASETFMTALGASSWVDDTVLNSDLWCDATFNSTYFLQIYDDLIPQATDNTMSYGTFEGTYDTEYNCCYPFQAFNKYPGYRWSSAPGYSSYDFWNFMDSYVSNNPGYLTFKGNRKIKPMFIQVSPVDNGAYSSPANEYSKGSCIKSFTLSYSTDNNSFVKLQDYLLSDNYEQEYSVIKNGSHPSHIFKIDNPVVCSGFSFSDVTSFKIGAGSATAGEIYIYGRII